MAVFPRLDLVTVVTNTNYNTARTHDQTDRVLWEYMLASVHPEP